MSHSLFLSHQLLLDHGRLEHPENSNRLQAIFQAFEQSPYVKLLELSCHREATKKELLRVHNSSYVDEVLSLDGKESSLDAETLITKGTVKAVCLAAGLGLELVEQVVKGKVQNGFALLRPPGHHARPSAGMGFCVFNHIAIAAKHALSLGLKRIVILDWDVHHGNGTQEVFYEDDHVLFIDIHQDRLFPLHSGLIHEKGSGKGKGYTVNVPLPRFCQDGDYLYIFDKLVQPIVERFNPELILVSAGFDAHESDPMGFMNLTTQGFGHLTKKVRSLAETCCEGKLILFLEGGYNPYFLAENVMACIEVLKSDAFGKLNEEVKPFLKDVEKLVKELYEDYFL